MSDESMTDLEARAEAARARVEAKIAARREAATRRKLEEQIRLADLQDEHGDVAAIYSPRTGRMIAIKPPSEAAYQRFQDKAADQRKPTGTADFLTLVKSCLVHPSPKDLEAMLSDEPALLVLAANAATKLAGMNEEALEGK